MTASSQVMVDRQSRFSTRRGGGGGGAVVVPGSVSMCLNFNCNGAAAGECVPCQDREVEEPAGGGVQGVEEGGGRGWMKVEEDMVHEYGFGIMVVEGHEDGLMQLLE